MKRGKISLNCSLEDLLIDMCEGNPGGLTVLVMLVKDNPRGFTDVLHLDDMNIWGEQIWVAYKDFAGEDLEKFRAALRARDPKMVEVINRHVPDKRAVTSGASFTRPQ